MKDSDICPASQHCFGFGELSPDCLRFTLSVNLRRRLASKGYMMTGFIFLISAGVCGSVYFLIDTDKVIQKSKWFLVLTGAACLVLVGIQTKWGSASTAAGWEPGMIQTVVKYLLSFFLWLWFVQSLWLSFAGLFKVGHLGKIIQEENHFFYWLIAVALAGFFGLALLVGGVSGIAG